MRTQTQGLLRLSFCFLLLALSGCVNRIEDAPPDRLPRSGFDPATGEFDPTPGDAPLSIVDDPAVASRASWMPAGTTCATDDGACRRASRTYGVVLIEADDVLNVRAEPGVGAPIVDTLAPESVDIEATGRETIVEGARWVEIVRPGGGTGWVNAYYLTELISPEAFCSSTGVSDLLGDLGRALQSRDGDALFAVVSPAHGMSVQLVHDGRTVHYTDEQSKWLFDSEYINEWGTSPSGEPVRGTFSELVVTELLKTFSSPLVTQQCNEIVVGAATYTPSWPATYGNVNFYSIHIPSGPDGSAYDWQTWVVGVELVEGQPYVFSLNRFAWEI